MKKILLTILMTCGIWATSSTNAREVFANSYSCGEKFTISAGGSYSCACAYTNNTANRIEQNSDGSFEMCCGDYANGVCRKEKYDPNTAQEVGCGETYDLAKNITCKCSGTSGVTMPSGNGCCGWVKDGACKSSKADVNINDIEVTADTLNQLNPLTIAGGSGDLTTPGGIISRALTGFIFPIAGLILFIQLTLGGFQMLTGAANSKSMDEGKGKITAAIVGFIILFAAYWIAQLLELIFGIRILS